MKLRIRTRTFFFGRNQFVRITISAFLGLALALFLDVAADAQTGGVGSICSGEKPALGISLDRAYWSSFDDYGSGILSVDYFMNNYDLNPVSSVNIVGDIDTSGVSHRTVMPVSLGDIAGHGSKSFKLLYQVPPETAKFMAEIFATAYDGCGTKWAYPGSFDDSPPTTTDNAPATWQTGDVNVVLTCTDSVGGSGCSSTTYEIDGGLMQTGNTVSITQDGTHRITYRSRDHAGNEETPSRLVIVRLDKTPPDIDSVTPGGVQTSIPDLVEVRYHKNPITDSGISGAWLTMDGGAALNDCSGGRQDSSDLRCNVSGLHWNQAYHIGGYVTDIAGNHTPISGSFAAIDDDAPIIDSVLPWGNMNSLPNAVEVFYHDPGNSGVNTSSINVTIDGGATMNCYVPATGEVYCDSLSGLNLNQTYHISGSVADNAGNVTPIIGSILAVPMGINSNVLINTRLLASFQNTLGTNKATTFVSSGSVALANDGITVSRPNGVSSFDSEGEYLYDYYQPFWFAVDGVFGFNRADAAESQDTKDIINIGLPVGDGSGMLNNRGIILHYSTGNKWFQYDMLDADNIRLAPADYPAFVAGDPFRFVCSWDEVNGIQMFWRIKDKTGYVQKAGATNPYPLLPNSLLTISDCQAWSKYGNYQFDSKFRYLVFAPNEMLTATVAYSYLDNPSSFFNSG